MASERDFLITVLGVNEPFQTITGGDTVAESSKDFDGGSDVPVVLTGPPTTEPIVVGRRFDSDRDNAVIRRNRPRVGSWETTVTKQPLDPAGVADGDPTVYRGKLIRQTDPEANRNSSAKSQYEMTFEVISVS